MIRRMLDSDIDSILAIDSSCFIDSKWTKQQFEYELHDNPYAALFVYENAKQEIIGYYDVWIIYERAEIARIAVDVDYQNQGIGNELLSDLQTFAKSKECDLLALEVRVSNEKALTLYQKFNFVVVNTKPSYYQTKDGYEDGYFMMKGI